MKINHKILAVAVIACTSLTASLATYAHTDAKTCKARTECADKAKCCQAQKAFKGIELTEAQKSQLKELCEQNCAQAKKVCAEAKAERACCDSTIRAQRMQARLDYLHSVQKVLTPEQYITFLENTAVMQLEKAPRPGRDGKGLKGKKGMKGQKRPGQKDKPCKQDKQDKQDQKDKK